jgi:hypothetical protein
MAGLCRPTLSRNGNVLLFHKFISGRSSGGTGGNKYGDARQSLLARQIVTPEKKTTGLIGF